MSPVCVVGMHRSGTSMVTRLLSQCGLYLGPPEQLLHANAANPEGHFEHEPINALNDEVLRRLGGDWDAPPRPVMWILRRHRLVPLRAQARDVIRVLDDGHLWGWKDPRNSLTLPFWLRVVPRLTVVVCARAPTPTAESLVVRNAMSFEGALLLWEHYNRRILATAPRRRTVVTWYDSYFVDPEREIERVARAVGLCPSPEAIAQAVATVKPELRHHTASTACRLPPRVERCQARLLAFAEGQSDQPANVRPV